MSQPVRVVVVVGRDIALWLTASVLRMALRPAGIDVHAVELPTDLSLADCCVTLPPLEALHRQLRIKEATLIRSTGGSFTLGQNFTANPPNGSFLHAYGSAGTGIDRTDFFGHWLKARRFGLNVGLDDFSLPAAAARQGRLFIPDDDSDIYGASDYAYHLPAFAYASCLKSAAVSAGVTPHQSTAVRPVPSADGSRIAAVELDDGHWVEGQLFIDCTGPDGSLLQALGATRQSWGDSFAGDRVLTALAPKLSPTPVYAEVRATDNGWVGLFPTQGWTHVVHLFGSAECSDDEATRQAMEASGASLSDLKFRERRPGIQDRLWTGNCVAVGPAACVFDPIHGVDLHAIQLGLVHLLSTFPTNGDFDAQAREYDRLTRSALEKLREFQSAHYTLSRYKGQFWERSRTAVQSSELQHRIATFEARGEIAPWEDDSFSPDSWRTLFLGHGLMPDSYAPAIDRTDPEHLKTELRRMLGFVRDQVLRQPTHAAYLERVMRGPHD